MAAGLDYYVRTFTSGSTGRNRWGDYTATVVDPLDDSFWTFNEYALTRGTAFGGEDGRWGTRWGKFTASLNNQPSLTPSGTAYLDTISVNIPSGSNAGTLISDIISRMGPGGGITDPDGGDPQGIAINGATGTSTGTWEFSTDGGSSWTPIGTVDNDSARLLASEANTRLRYVPNAGFKGTAKIAFVAWDQSSGANGGTGVTKFRVGASPFSLNYDLASISVTNTAPVLDNSGAPTLDSITVNMPNGNNPGTLIDTIISRMSPGGITDSDPGAVQGIAINGLGGTSTGTWEYSTDDGSNWAAVGTTGNANARLLAADGQTRIRYVPNINFTGSVVFAFVAWDQTVGTNGGTAAVGTRGGTTPFSLAYDYASISVTNSAPVLDNSGNPTLTSIPVNIGNDPANTGTSIEALIAGTAGITDSDPSAQQGIAINGLVSTNGTWEYTVNNGTNWTPVGTTGNSDARLLAADGNTRVRFVPNPQWTGTAKIAFVAWDRTSGSNGGTANVASRGGTTAFSVAYEYASITVTNAAPVLNVTDTAFLDAIPSNIPLGANTGTLVSDIIARSGGITDPDPAALQGIAINGLTGIANGTWEFSTDGGTSWAAIGTTGNANARLLASDLLTRIRFVPNFGFIGSVRLAFVAWDLTSGVNGGIAAVGTRGGSTAFSALYDYADLAVLPPV